MADRQIDRETDKQTDRQSHPHSTSTSKLREKRRFPLTSIVKICSKKSKNEREIGIAKEGERQSEISKRSVCLTVCVCMIN